MKKILIADGMLERAERIADFLEGEFEVRKACSEQAVLDLCLILDFDLVVCGCSLRDIPGVELIKKIKGVQPDIKTILVSGSIGPATKEIKELGINAFIEKPFKLGALKNIVDLVLEG